MAKVIFGAKPKTFAEIPVKFTGPEGQELTIQTVYKYRTTKEYGAFLNDLFKDSGETAPDAGSPDFEALFVKNAGRTVDSLLKAIESWDIPEHEVSRENLLRLADEMPAGPVALMAAYRSACIGGRLGN
jgi:Phage tail assembly chaperone